MTNEQAIKDFAATVDRGLNVSPTERVNNIPVKNGWAAACVAATPDGVEIGITAACHGNGIFGVFVEIHGGRDVARSAGEIIERCFRPDATAADEE